MNSLFIDHLIINDAKKLEIELASVKIRTT